MPRTSANKPDQANVLKDTSVAVFNQNTPLTETVKMISRGMLQDIPKEITIKAVQRKDKKKALLSETDNILLSLLQNCIISPTNFNVYNLMPFESKYLLYRLRILSYGATHTFKDTCPYCNHLNDINMDLNSIPIVDVPDNFKLTFDISLPVSGDILTCKLLTEGEREAVSKKAKELKEMTGNQSAEIDTIWEARVIAINGDNKIAPIEITQYLDNLGDYDSEYFMKYYNQYEGNYGLESKLSYMCDKCGKHVESEMPSIYTFFRPTITLPESL